MRKRRGNTDVKQIDVNTANAAHDDAAALNSAVDGFDAPENSNADEDLHDFDSGESNIAFEAAPDESASPYGDSGEIDGEIDALGGEIGSVEGESDENIESSYFISDADLSNIADFIDDYNDEICENTNRIAGSDSETAVARIARDKLRKGMDVPAKMEAYEVYPLLGRGMLPMAGLWLTLCYVFYYISFAGKGVAGVILTVGELLLLLLGGGALIYLWLGGKRFRFLLRKKPSYNVVGEIGKGDKTVVIAASHDQPLGTVVPGKFRKPIPYLAGISAVILALFSVLKAALGTDGAQAKLVCFVVLPAVLGLWGAAGLIFYFSPLAAHCKHTDGKTLATATAAFAFLSERLPDDVKLVFASFGGSGCCEQGARAFCDEHPEYSSAKAICLSRCGGKAIRAVAADSARRIKYSSEVYDAIVAAANDANVEISLAENLDDDIDGYKSSPLTALGADSAELLLPENANSKQAFKVLTGAVLKLFDLDFKSASTAFKAKQRFVRAGKKNNK